MKNFALKASVLAMGVAFSGYASAAVTVAVDLDLSPTGAATYAQELAYNDATPLAGAANALNFQTKLGFGISNTQTRYMRVDFGNATLDAAMTAVDGTDIEVANNAAAGDSFAVVQGGQIGDSYVIYQYTAGADYAATAILDVLVPALRVTSTAAPVTVTYQLHETAVSAVAGASGAALLYNKTGNIATFVSSLSFTATAATVTADVATLYKAEVDLTGGASDTTQMQLGTIVTDILDTSLERDGSAVDQADLITAATITVTGDFSAVGTTGTVTLSSAACNTPAVVSTGVVSSDKQTVTFSGAAVLGLYPDPAAAATTSFLCYNADGVTAIPVASMTATPGFTAAAGATLGSIAGQAAGTVIHNGTTLKVPYAAGKAGQGAWVQLTNTSANNAGYTTACYNSTGASTAGASGTITAGRSAQIYAGALCPAGSVSAVMTLAVPNGSVIGSFVRQNTTSGDMGLDGVVGNQ